MVDFPLWLYQEIARRGWTQNEFARKAGMTSQHISAILSGSSTPGLAFVKKAAPTLGVSREALMRKVGMLEPLPNEVENEKELVNLFRVADQSMRTAVLEMLRSYNASKAAGAKGT